jgi:tetratricopeptide (TPR) repeat protein
MRGTISGVLLVLLVMVSLPVLAAEEELFDTKAAIELREKGRQLLNTRKYDAAIEALEESVDTAPDAEAFYLLGYAYYMKGKAGDEESKEKAKENFEEAYTLNPNFSPSKFKPEEISAPEGEKSLGEAAPASKQASPPAPAAPATEQPKQ